MNPHEEGDSEGKDNLQELQIQIDTHYTNQKRYKIQYRRRNTNTTLTGEETHKTMLEEGGGSEKAFTGICEQMVCKHLKISSQIANIIEIKCVL